MSGLTILGYVLMVLGVIVSIGGGIIKPIDLMGYVRIIGVNSK